jgi:hypothetical protein
MTAPSKQPGWIQRSLDRFSKSREVTISFCFHLILVAVFGTAILFEVVQEPSDFQGGGDQFVGSAEHMPPAPREDSQSLPPTAPIYDITDQTPDPAINTPHIITRESNPNLDIHVPRMMIPGTGVAIPNAADGREISSPAPETGVDGLTPEAAKAIAQMARGWGAEQGPGVGAREREFEFVAYIGQYGGGNWDSTVRTQGDKVTAGSLPNLLWTVNAWSGDRIQTNDKKVRAVRLDSDEIFALTPSAPFIFMTGTRDFVLTDKEVETLRKYVRSGGAIWGDSSLPGRNSRFDIAFRREMRRVIPDVDKDFEPLPANHPIFTKGYFPEIKDVPPGLNFYREPVYALSIYGEIAILYTANDYGNMWQIGLNENGRVDLRRDERNQFVAVNQDIWNHRFLYLGNIQPPDTPVMGGRMTSLSPGRAPEIPENQQGPLAPNLIDTYKFGTNIIVHLLTRWDRVVSAAPGL